MFIIALFTIIQNLEIASKPKHPSTREMYKQLTIHSHAGIQFSNKSNKLWIQARTDMSFSFCLRADIKEYILITLLIWNLIIVKTTLWGKVEEWLSWCRVGKIGLGLTRKGYREFSGIMKLLYLDLQTIVPQCMHLSKTSAVHKIFRLYYVEVIPQ